MTIQEMFDILRVYEIANEDFIDGAVCVGGYNEETAERILFYHTGWRTFEGFLEEFNEEE